VHRVRGRSLQIVEAGPAAGIKLRSHRASGDYRSGTNERPVQEALAALLHPGDVFYDIGSNIGFFALLAARIVGPTGLVVAFEPVPDNARAISRNADLNDFGWLETVEVAVSERSGQARLLLAEHPGGATLAADEPPADHVGDRQVRTASIDDLLASGSLRPPDVVKIDVEGAEAAVLRGMRSTLAEHSPVLVCEIDAESAPKLSAKIEQIRELLDRSGYGIEELEHSYDLTVWHVWHCIARRRP
jgi:FkbM family methyltransferase